MNNPTPCRGIQLGNKNGEGKNISSVLSIKEAIEEGAWVWIWEMKLNFFSLFQGVLGNLSNPAGENFERISWNGERN